MYSGPQFSNCSTVDLNTVNLVFSGTGAICCLISIVIIVLILFNKAYNSVLQRFFLYLMASILLRELFIVASLEHHYKYDKEIQDKVCAAIGLIWNWSGIMVFIFTVGMKVYLFIYVKRLTRGDTGPVFVQSGCGRVTLESLYVVLSVFVTICYAFVPFFTKNYGLAGPWCWIRAIDENCTVSTSGLINQILNGYVFYVPGSIIGLVLLIGIAVLYCRLPSTLGNESRLLLKKTFFVIITFVANIVIAGFALLTRVTAGIKRQYDFPGTWYCFAITWPISLLLFPIVYMICFFRTNHVFSCYKELPQGRNEHSIQNPTIPKSSRLSAPSETFCDLKVPYTNNFTVIDENTQLVLETSGYGSVQNMT